jgi:hypothetical protein
MNESSFEPGSLNGPTVDSGADLPRSSFARLIGALVSPEKTFRSIAERPSWALPMILLIVLGIGLQTVMQKRVDPEELIRQQTKQMGIELTQEQIDKGVKSIENQTPTRRIAGAVFGAAIAAATYFVTALIFWVAFRMFGSDIDYVRSLATVAHGLLPFGIALLINIPMVLARGSIDYSDMMNGGVLMSNLGFLANDDTGTAARMLLHSIDFFSIWAIVLLVIGFRATAKVRTAMATTIVLAVWGLGVALKIGLVSLPGLIARRRG